MLLWPRLAPIRAVRQATSFIDAPDTFDDQEWHRPDLRAFAATGGVPVTDGLLHDLRSRVTQAASECGYPGAIRPKSRLDFDRRAGVVLVDAGVPLGEGLRTDVWAWIATALLPRVVYWRWPHSAGQALLDRFCGSVYRNALGRAWLAAITLDRGAGHGDRWGILNSLGADQVVALLERPTIAGNPLVARAIGQEWFALKAVNRTEDLFRETMKSLVVHASIRRLDVLNEVELRRTARQQFELTARYLGMELG